LARGASKLEGTPRQLADISFLSALGWLAQTPVCAGLSLAYRHFLAEGVNRREV
jgi:hypothetical protein